MDKKVTGTVPLREKVFEEKKTMTTPAPPPTAYHAGVYDLFHDSETRDARWYTENALKVGGPVLELGAGTGRTLLPIARCGIAIDGLERDEGMLQALREKVAKEDESTRGRVRCFPGDMRDFSLSERYALVQIPFRAFLHNLSFAEQMACLRCCFVHLRPGGELALNVFHPSLTFMSRNHDSLAGVWRWRDERVTAEGKRIVLSDMTVYRTVEQRLCARLRYECFDAGGFLEWTFLQALELSYLYPGDVHRLLKEAGFVNVEIQGGFDGQALQKDGEEMLVLAKKP